MSLFDVDKQGDFRVQPALNADDNVANRMAHATAAITLRDTASSVTSRAVMKDGKLEVYNSSDSRVARIGVRETDTEGAVDTAKPGSSV